MSLEWALVAKVGLGAALTVVAVLVWQTSRIDRPTPSAVTRWFVGSLLGTRLGLFLALFWLVGVPVTSDVSGHYHPQATAVLAGQVPYRDFPTSYGLAFPYLAALHVWLGGGPRSLVLLAIVTELLAAPLWLAVGRRLAGEAVARRAALLYVLSPLPLVNVAVNGQNQILVAAGLGLASHALVYRRDVLSGLLVGALGGGVKFLALLFAPVLALASRRPLVWTAACTVGPLALLGIGWLAHLDVLMPVRLEAPLFSSGNVPFVLGVLGLDLDSPAVQWILSVILLMGLGAILVGIRLYREGSGVWLAHAIALLVLAFLILSRKSYTNYLVMVFFPLCLSTAAGGLDARTVVCFGALGTIAAVEPSAWFRWLGRRGLWELGSAALPAGQSGLAIFAVLEGGLLAGYAWLISRSWRALRGSGALAPELAGARPW